MVASGPRGAVFLDVMKPSPRTALTLMETVVALGILALLLVSSAAFFTRMLWSSDKSGDQSAGFQLAERILQESIDQQAFDLPPTDRQVRLYTHDAGQQTEFTYRLTSTPVYLPQCSAPSYALDVHVRWFGGGPGETRSGRGLLEAHLHRLVTP